MPYLCNSKNIANRKKKFGILTNKTCRNSFFFCYFNLEFINKKDSNIWLTCHKKATISS